MFRLPAAPINARTLARIGAGARPAFIRAAAAIAVAKVAIGLGALVFGLATGLRETTGWRWLMLAHVTVFSATGLLLVLGGRRDRRAMVLGTAFLLVASVFADQLLVPFREMKGLALTIARGVSALQVDALTPYCIWLFLREFPRASHIGRVRRRLRLATDVSFTVGVVLFAGNLLGFIASLRPEWSPLEVSLRPLSRYDNEGLYWPAQFALSIAALPMLLWRSRRARVDERRRASLLVWGLVIGTMPTIAWVLFIGPFPAARAVLPLQVAGWVLYPTLLSTPVTTAYAVLVRHALDARLVVRRAAQYALARFSVTTLAIAPIVLLAGSIYGRRNQSMVALATSSDALVLVGLSGVGLVALRGRRRVLESIDRRFFREQYDARRILGDLVDGCRVATTRLELADYLRAEIDRALHLRSTTVLFLDPDARRFVSPRDDLRPLDAQSALAALVETSSGGVLEADLERSESRVARLPDLDRHWLVDSGTRLLLPLKNAERRVIGLIALGEKRSELPYSTEDASLLAAVASATEMTIAYHGLGPRSVEGEGELPPAREASSEPFAAECETCGAVEASGRTVCSRCASAMRECPLPEVVAAKFRIEQRIGVGGMGIVYRGTDLDLDRPVAVKTLPFVFPEEAIRLRREARAMALVSHPHLAIIFGVETWRGRPMLVCEYLAGGTLTTRIKLRPLPIPAALDMAIALASALDAIHGANVLHLDVKPSNIGFGLDGTPKLLDFGISRMLTATVDDGRLAPRSDRGMSALVTHLSTDNLSDLRSDGSVVRGTPLYMSPEALQGTAPEASFDLWSLCLVLYESIAGRNPFHQPSWFQTRGRILSCDVPDIRLLVPTAPSELADLFRDAFSRDPRDRPETAKALGDWLRTARGAIAVAGDVDASRAS